MLTLPYNAHAAASFSRWTGLPVLTLVACTLPEISSPTGQADGMESACIGLDEALRRLAALGPSIGISRIAASSCWLGKTLAQANRSRNSRVIDFFDPPYHDVAGLRVSVQTDQTTERRL